VRRACGPPGASRDECSVDFDNHEAAALEKALRLDHNSCPTRAAAESNAAREAWAKHTARLAQGLTAPFFLVCFPRCRRSRRLSLAGRGYERARADGRRDDARAREILRRRLASTQAAPMEASAGAAFTNQ